MSDKGYVAENTGLFDTLLIPFLGPIQRSLLRLPAAFPKMKFGQLYQMPNSAQVDGLVTSTLLDDTEVPGKDVKPLPKKKRKTVTRPAAKSRRFPSIIIECKNTSEPINGDDIGKIALKAIEQALDDGVVFIMLFTLNLTDVTEKSWENLASSDPRLSDVLVLQCETEFDQSTCNVSFEKKYVHRTRRTKLPDVIIILFPLSSMFDRPDHVYSVDRTNQICPMAFN
jgi:hypothetical protein